VEPADSPVLSKGSPGYHQVQGLGPGFIPKTLNTKIYDEVIAVSSEDAFNRGREAAKFERLLVGISSGAALCAATEVAKRAENLGEKMPDTGERYLSTPLYFIENAL
jgi:cysteine synthase A